MSMVVAVSGRPGTGTSTLGDNLAKTFNFKLYQSGERIRVQASEMFPDVSKEEAFQKFLGLMKENPDIDRQTDEQAMIWIREMLKSRTPAVVEARLAAYFSKIDSLPVLRILLVCDEVICAERVAARSGITLAEAVKQNRIRTESDLDRYEAVHGIKRSEPFNPLNYHFVVNTGEISADRLMRMVYDQLVHST